MPLTIEDFRKPDQHAFDMLAGFNLKHTYECEQVLTFILAQCKQRGNLKPVQCAFMHPALVEAGLITEHDRALYSLTDKALGLLWGYYANDEVPG